MKPREDPPPPPPVIDRAQVHQLIRELAAARDCGEPVHQHPLLYELENLCGLWAGYRFQLDDPRTSAELYEFEEAIVQHGPAWLAQQERVTKP